MDDLDYNVEIFNLTFLEEEIEFEVELIEE